MSDSNIIISDDVVLSLFGAFPQIADVFGIGKGTCGIFDQVPASEIMDVKLPSEAAQRAYGAGSRVINGMCAGDFKAWTRQNVDEMLLTGTSERWNAREIMRNLNRFVGKQHALDGKFLEGLVMMIVIHFIGQNNVVFHTQAPTGSRVGGHTDIEVDTGDGRFLLEVKTQMGVDWKRTLIEHQITDDKGEMTHQPFFLITLSNNLKACWIDEMIAQNCQPVSINFCETKGVVSLDSLIKALQMKIAEVKEQKKTLAV
jgi:hypothetical protein